ncbi:hypothetical protein [Polaromonas sp.]|uniref:hypothetical protein n=1 Tax=Polaromonas sp. TaxID=1869339 RepID=UPI002730D31C|nr:hypothetical protein [Polaromonas sp.]MDP1884881.1 hypothetical protein [Polaromonas sp.]
MTTKSSRPIWLGMHRSVGIVVFDPSLQADVESGQVQLWDVDAQQLRVFDRSKTRGLVRPLRRHLIECQLEPLVVMHGVLGQVAKRYLANRPTLARSESEEPVEAVVPIEDTDEERRLLIQDFVDEQDAYARSEEDGWFYDD